MKCFFLLFLCFVGSVGFSQKKYHFDYVLLYENSSINSKTKTSDLYFINSKSINYYLGESKDKDSINMNLIFLDHNGISSISKIAIQDFYKAEVFANECNSVLKYSNQYKYKANEYTFVKHNDTLINNVFYFHYEIKSIKSIKYQKRKKIQSAHLIIDKKSQEFTPFLYNPLFYNLYSKTPILPNGLFKIIYYTNLKGEITFKRELLNVVKSDKYLTIPEECDYTKSPK
jgi:hypothetical protein